MLGRLGAHPACHTTTNPAFVDQLSTRRKPGRRKTSILGQVNAKTTTSSEHTTAGVVCGYRSARGNCKAHTCQGSDLYCTRHACPTTNCTRAKNSSAQACDQCSLSSPDSVSTGSSAALRTRAQDTQDAQSAPGVVYAVPMETATTHGPPNEYAILGDYTIGYLLSLSLK